MSPLKAVQQQQDKELLANCIRCRQEPLFDEQGARVGRMTKAPSQPNRLLHKPRKCYVCKAPGRF